MKKLFSTEYPNNGRDVSVHVYFRLGNQIIFIEIIIFFLFSSSYEIQCEMKRFIRRISKEKEKQNKKSPSKYPRKKNQNEPKFCVRYIKIITEIPYIKTETYF